MKPTGFVVKISVQLSITPCISNKSQVFFMSLSLPYVKAKVIILAKSVRKIQNFISTYIHRLNKMKKLFLQNPLQRNVSGN
jgi:hypothetical protein